MARRPPPPRNPTRERNAALLVDAIGVVNLAARKSLGDMPSPDAIITAAATLQLAGELAELGRVLRAAKGVVVIDPSRVAELVRGGK